MPDNAPVVKRNAVEEYGATITTCPSTQKDREESAQKLLQVHAQGGESDVLTRARYIPRVNGSPTAPVFHPRSTEIR